MDNKFSRSINNIDDSIFNKYYNYEEKLKAQKAIKIRKRNKFIALAACLTLCVCVSVALILPAMKSTEPTIEPDNILEVNTNNELSSPEDSTGEAATTEDSTSNNETSEDTVIERETTTVETQNTHPYEIRVDDYTLVKNESGCYFIFDDISKYQKEYAEGSVVAADIPFGSIKELKDAVTKGLLEEWQKYGVAGFSDNGIDIQICDFNNLYEPTLPQECSTIEVYWEGETYSYLVMMSDESFGVVEYHTKESYDKRYSYEYEKFFDRDTITVTGFEERDGKEITHYKTSIGKLFRRERYTLTKGNITVQVDKDYYSLDDTLSRITLYCTGENLYYTVTLYSLAEDPSDEWLLQFGLKRYIDEQDFANDMGIYSSTNLEFWIADNVDNFDFSEHQQKYGLMGGDEYYGKSYTPTYDEYNQQVDPEHCVIYTITSYPDYSDKEKHISRIAITDPLVTLYGLINVNSTEEEFTRVMEANGFTVERTGAVGLIAKKGDYSISLCLNELVIRVDIKNEHGIIF